MLCQHLNHQGLFTAFARTDISPLGEGGGRDGDCSYFGSRKEGPKAAPGLSFK